MNQRIDIINNSRIFSASKSKPLQKRIYNSLSLIIIFSILSTLGILGILFSMIVDWFGLNFNLSWDTSSTIVVSSIFCLVFLAESLYSYILLKHIKRGLAKSIKKNVQAINTELQIILTQKVALTNNKLVFVLGLVILICALLVKIFDTEFIYMYVWNYFKIPLLIFYVLFFRQTIKNLILIKRNNMLYEISSFK